MMTKLDINTITSEQLAKVIDHSLLKPELTEKEVIEGCKLAHQYHTATVCVKPCDVKLAASILKESDVLVSTVIGFPHGANKTSIKLAEANQAMDDGAVELDFVINIGQLRSGNYEYVQKELQVVCDVVHSRNGKIKVIFENAYLNDEEKVIACKLSEKAGADWVKTSTGFSPSGATLEDLKLMRDNVNEKVQVKAAGGIRTLDALLSVIDVGVTRCGATATKLMLDDFKNRKNIDHPAVDGEPISNEY